MKYALAFVWNPSEGIDLGFFTIRYYSLMFVVAFSVGLFLLRKIFVREEESMEKLDSLFITCVAATLIGARLGHVFFYDWGYYKNNLLEIFLPVRFSPKFEFIGFQGLASHGAAIGIIVALYFFSKNTMKRSTLWVLDRVVIAVAAGGIFVRIGNFFNSEIIGHETTSSFGIRFLHDKFNKYEVIDATHISNSKAAYSAIANDPKFGYLLEQVPAKHPTQLYEAFCYIFVFIALYLLYWKTDARKKTGFLFGLFLTLLFSIRFVIEFVKESQGGFETYLGDFLSTGQWLSIPFIFAGLYFIFTSKKTV